MKKVFLYLTAALTVLSVFSCTPKEEPEVYPDEAMAKVSQTALVDAAAAAYAVWEDETVLPEKLSVEGEAITKAGTLELTQPQYQYALAQALVDIAAGKTDDIIVLGYKPAQHPDRDSYTGKEIAVKGGAELKNGTEDLASFAARFIEDAKASGTIPNRVLVEPKTGDAMAFSTNRLTVSLLRALAGYKADKALPASVSTDYLSAAATLKGFAQQFVGILDIWEKTVGTVSADGSHCTDNNSAWQNVHFVPIPHSGGAYADGVDQYDAKYQPYFTVEIDGTTYNTAQTWGIALRGIMNLVTKEGSAKIQQNRNPFEHTMGNGGSLKDPIPATTEFDSWGNYPWYESTNDDIPVNQSELGIYMVARNAAWFLARQIGLGHIGNYMQMGTDPDSMIVEEGYKGFISAMRMWLIAARFYKYLLDNNITDNVYDAVKDVKFATDLYGVEMPDIDLKTKSVTINAEGTGVTATFNAKESWTATASESWIHVDPASGSAATPVSVSISADANTGDERTGEVVIKGGNVTDGLVITVTQSKYIDPSSVTLKEFAQEFVKGLDVWAATVGTVESENKHLIEKGTAWENVHFIPVGKTGGDYDNHPGNQHDDKYTPWTLNVGGTEYTSAQAWEIAVRGLLDMVLTDGQDYIGKMTSRNKPGYTLGDNKAFSEIMTVVPSDYAKWNGYPWYEEDGVTYNGQPVEEVGVDMITKATLGHLVRGLVGIPGVFTPLGAIGNFQQFGSDDSTLMLDGYEGLISPMRELILMLRVYKYLLDNNIDKNVYSAIKDVKFDYDMYGQDVPETPKPTIADFVKEFAKAADAWDSNIGTVSFTRDGKEYKYEKVHYIPDSFVITLNGTNYNKYQMHEMAMRALKALEAGGSLNDEITAPGSYEPATSPYYEYDDPLKETEAGIDLLSNFATRCLNYLGSYGEWPNVCGYPRTADPVLTTYNGYVCIERNLVMLARLCRYMVENNVTSVASLANVKVSTELWGEVPSVTIADFAKEYVKILDVWQKTTGPVTMYKDSEVDYTVDNAHYVPSGTTITVGGKEYNTADMFETALRSYLLVRGYNGLDTENYGKNSISALDGGAVSMRDTEVPETHGYAWGSWPYNETPGNGGHLVMGDDENGIHSQVKTDILDNWAMRSLNFNHGQNITNLCGYASGQFPGYYGCFCSQRALITYAFFFKYMLDNNLDKGTQVGDDVIIRSELFGDEAPVATIGDFAKEYVKILDVWEKTTGTINYLTGQNPGTDIALDLRDAHYVPASTTINVAGQTIAVGDMLEIAERSYLLLRGMDGNQTSGALGAFASVTPATLDTPMPECHGSTFGPASYNENGSTYAGKAYNSNGGPLKMGDPAKADGKASSVKLDILDNFAQRHVNWPMTHDGVHSNMCGYTERLDGYYGCFSAQRALVTYAFFFKYMLDNNLTEAMNISDQTVFRSENVGNEYDDCGAGPNSIKAFAEGYVRLLNFWERTTGTINFLTGENPGDDPSLDNPDAHYIPGDTRITINGDNSYKKTFTTADFLEVAERAYLLLRGMDGNQTSGALGAFASVTPATLTTDMPESHETSFGPASFNESGTTSVGGATTGNGGHLKMGNPKTADGKSSSVKFDILDNFAQRHVNWPMTHDGVHSNMCGYIERLDGYYGCFSAQRALVTYAFFFEYMLRNGHVATSTIPEDTIFRSEEFGDE